MTVGSALMLKAGDVEVYGNTATASTVKDKFQLPHQGVIARYDHGDHRRVEL